MFYIVGLGNPEPRYEKTRHNAGWWVLDAMVAAWELPSPVLRKRALARLSEGVFLGEEVTIVYPDTYMNNSGAAVAKIVPKDTIDKLIVVYDDVDLAIGKIKISFGNGAGGHNGVASVIQRLATKDFIRVRIGVSKVDEAGSVIRPQGEDLCDLRTREGVCGRDETVPSSDTQSDRGDRDDYDRREGKSDE